MVKTPCVFLDRDGVIVVPEFRDGRSFAPKTLEAFQLFPDAKECLLKLKKAGVLLVVITNQPDVGNGITPQSVVEAMHERLFAELPIDHIEVCYHTRNNACDCRKPKPGMLLNAEKHFLIDFEKSFLIGDRSSDLEAGDALQLNTLFIDFNYNEPLNTKPTYHCGSLAEAVDSILSHMASNASMITGASSSSQTHC